SGPVRAIGMLNGGGEVLKLRSTVGKIRLQYLDADTGLRDSLIREQRERINRWHDPDFLPVNSFEPAPPVAEPPPFDEKSDWLEGWMDKLEIALLGGLREDSDDFFKRLTAAPNPVYPDLARRAGIEGIVKLQVKVKTDGSIEVQKVLEGEPVLADAAMDALKKWRAKPALINGIRVETISTVTFNFELHH
ncbi:MAG: energy transducer TonB, partial [Candidatus Acidiferrum sp.]